MKIILLSLVAPLIAISEICEAALAHNSIQGLWSLPQDGTVISIEVRDHEATGTIFRRPGNRTDEIDKYNPRPELRQRPIVGLKILSELKPNKRGTWKGGNAYDPDSGRTYRAFARLEDDDTLVMRGYIGIPLFGKSVILKRYKND